MFIQTALTKFFSWFDSSRVKIKDTESEKVDWLRVSPFILVHVACLLVFVVGWSPIVIVVALFSYFIRMFAITAFYHRYFSHKSFRTSRACQFLFGLLGATATQRGPIWWASHHRRHHRYSDTDRDMHSPRKGFWWSHMGWFLSSKHFPTREQWVRDLIKFPELRFLDRFDIVIPVLYAVALWGFGKWLEISFPELGTTGWQMLIWGYFVSTIVLLHCTLSINSLSHVWGNQRYKTGDDSRNNGFLALITLG
ncbi:MAG: acyl-CoA desaturase, partial [Methylomicrobium sp.]|nr:acyl-CoA desaturase [Methylomicrobium sp.]